MAYTSDAEGQLLRQVVLARGGSQPVLDAVNHFYQFGIPKILSSYNIRTPEGLIGKFTNPILNKPYFNGQPLFPYQARRSELSYMAQLSATFEFYQIVGDQLIPVPGQQLANVVLGKVPVILQSILCHLYGLTQEQMHLHGEAEKDPGAYAIIKGQEKVLLNIENLRSSEAFLYEDKGEFNVRYTSQSLTQTSINIVKDYKDNVHVTFDAIGTDNSINVFSIFYILGLQEGTVEKVLNEIDNFILDDDPVKQKRRRKEMRYYMQLTKFNFEKLGADTKAIYDRVLDKVWDKTIKIDPNKYDIIRNLVWSQLFSNIPLVYKNQDELISILRSKIRLLASMIAKFVDFKNGYRTPDDRDSWSNKQLADSAKHLARKFNKIWESIIAEIDKAKVKNIAGVRKALKANFMAEQFIQAYTKNMFTIGKGRKQRDITIVDTLDRDNILAAIAHIRRISTPTNRRAKIREKRLIHNTQWGAVCPVFTQEGEGCGLTKDSAITTYISLDRDESLILDYLKGVQILKGAIIIPYEGNFVIQQGDSFFAEVPGMVQTERGVEYPSQPAYSIVPNEGNKYPLYINGIPIGFCDSNTLRNGLLQLRRSGAIYFDTGIILNIQKELKIFTNSGRVCRPLLIVDHDTQELVIDIKRLRGSSLEEIMSQGAIEYVDVAEQEQIQMLIAEDVRHLQMPREAIITASQQYQRLSTSRTPSGVLEATQKQIDSALTALQNLQNRMKYTHCEIDPTAILGISAISMPFPEFNQGPRVTYQSGMVKQSLGGNSSRIELRFDTSMKTILEPGVPTVSTDAHEFLGLDQYPSGRELIIAITTYGGSNQEDAITFNKAAVDLGLFLMMIYHSYQTTICQSRNARREFIRIPDYPPNQASRYSKLDPATGIVRLGETVSTGDCLVGKVIIDSNGVVTNDSLYVERGKEGVVDEVYNTINAENCNLVRIRIRELRKLQAGDKLASRYAQKGTIGAILPEKDMPWIVSEQAALNGIKPHVIFNPHGIPSRMTMGKLFEFTVGKVTAMTGERFNATAFRRFGQPLKEGEPPRDNLESFKDQLAEYGFSRSGKEKMVNGITGREMDAEIFIGTTYYQLLRHLVQDKMQARGTGSVQFLTRQPTSGIRREGGLRLGEMERDALLEYGASYLQQERMVISSDAYQAIICRECEMFASTDIATTNQTCRRCNTATFTRVRIPYAFKLLTNYLNAANLKVTFKTKRV